MNEKPAAPAAAKESPPIAEYHAHVYYDPQARLGRWHDALVGPHTRSMYQIAFPPAMLGAFVPWLMLNRDGLTILLHPETGDDLRDHTAHAAWFGAVLPLRLEAFAGGAAD